MKLFFSFIVQFTRIYTQIFLILLFFCTLRTTLASSPSLLSRGNNGIEIPFYMPQTNFVFGRSQNNLKLTKGDSSHTYYLNEGGIFDTFNTFGFDIEVNQSRFLNIGAYARYSTPRTSISDKNRLIVNSFIFGGFLKALYIPSFLSGKSTTANVFARFSLGAGPIFLIPENGGLFAQTAFHIGLETYLSRWFGLGASYGRIYDFGKLTLTGSGNFFNQATETLVFIKTTLF